MKKKYIAIAGAVLLILHIEAKAQSAKDYFLKMPDSFLPYLTKVNKEDMPDFIESKMAAKVKNRFQGTTEMKELSADYLSIETTSASTLQLKVLPLKGSERILVLITTANGPAPDSRVRFFTTDWKELPAKEFLSLPPAEAFILPVGTALIADAAVSADSVRPEAKNLELNPSSLLSDTVSQELYSYVLNKLGDVNLLSCSFVVGDPAMRVVLSTPGYLDERDREVVKQSLKKEPILLRWEEGRFLLPH